ncbi:MAG: VTT domain-containing protein [Syntrophomonadaceae bacterium]|nr:VTT domain-containing protein [Syntrophomonadaceae bacterium]MDD3888676.1 VTT domain-containing protein [Syntrophomonadaceae bacterium]MDD4548508.1 VTT domain-containing protein [Syntrophomonadaceae bacterium]
MDFFENVSSLSISMVCSYIKTFGLLAPAVAFVLFVVQAAVPIFPYIVLAAAGGLLFGFKTGFLLSWLGALMGACLAYWLCRWVDNNRLTSWMQKRFHYNVKKVDSEIAFWTIIIARIIPIVPTPIINVAAAFSGVPFWNFFLSSAIGKIPSAILYTGLGICLFQTRDIKLTLTILGFILALVLVGRLATRKQFNPFA